MIGDRRVLFVLIAVIAASCFVGVRTASSIQRHLASHTPKAGSVHEMVPRATLELVTKALASQKQPQKIGYADSVSCPFRTAGEGVSAPGSQTTRPPAADRNMLKLKGFLLKDKPLAILEDPRGGTSIRGVGDVVDGQKIVRITAQSVTIKDAHGTYELSVKNE